MLAFIVQTSIMIHNAQHSLWNASHLFFPIPLHSDHEFAVFEIHGITLKSPEYTSIAVVISNHILLYGVMTLSLWESLFSFYRHFTTMNTLEALEVPTTRRVLLLFSIYAAIFTLSFLFTVHCWYFMFPVVVLCHFLFNLHCTWTFSAALIAKYSAHGMDQNFFSNASTDSLNGFIEFCRLI